jgi:gliding motility-associated-like protein
MKKYLFFFYFLLLGLNTLVAQNWKADLQAQKGFIENKGQFKNLIKDPNQDEILFSFDGGSEDYFFTKKGHVLVYSLKEKRKKSEEEKSQRLARKKQGFKSLKEWQDFEKIGDKIALTQDELSCLWIGANSNVQIIAEEKNTFTHSFLINKGNNQQESLNNIPSYRKLTYKNLYPKIDLVYEFHPQGGLKYSLVLHPGANLHDIQLHYSKNLSRQSDGSLLTGTLFGDIKDHQPLTFYAGNKNQTIPSAYVIHNNIIGFQLGNYNPNQTIIIDPWTQSPSFNTNWDCVWECEKDGAGNIYIIGGVMPLQLIKYNAAGTLQWTYSTPYDSTSWLGSFSTDLAGNSYVCNGLAAALIKVNAAGALVWNNPTPGGLFSSTEFWSISFNCDQTKLVIGGTGGFLPPAPFIYEVDMNNGNVLTSVQVTNSPGGLFDPKEVRAITACGNGKYYFLAHDSLGYINQNLSACGGPGASIMKFDNGFDLGYKVENWRYNNSGVEAIKTFNNYVYVNRGNQLQKRDFFTGAVVASVAIPAGSFVTTTIPIIGTSSQVGNSGIDIDDCGNIYVGSTNGVYKFDTLLTALGNFPTSFNVYDVEVSIGGDVIAAGSTGNSNSNNRTGSVQSFAASACAPPPTVCCDASVCNIPSFCLTDAPLQLVATTAGGVWSGPGVNGGGLFDPALAGVGVFTVTYSLACGFESINITVNNCTALDVCEELNGTYTVSGGTGPYTWQVFSPASTTVINTQAECVACGYTWFFGGCFNPFPFPADSCTTPAGWTTYATGVNAPAPPNFPAQVIDNAGTIYTINSAAQILPCSNCPTITTTTSNQSDANCNGGNGSAIISSSGGAGPYTYTWMPGSLNGDTQNNLPAGTYTIDVTDANGCTGTFSLTINEPPALTYNSGAIPSTCNLPNGTAYAEALGGTSPYTYTWSNAGGNLQITNNVSIADSLLNLQANTYFVLIQDANGCSNADTLVISTSSSPIATLLSQNDATCGVNNGSIIISAAGGTGTFTVEWYDASGLVLTTTNVVSTDSIVNILAGNYTAIIIDANGCSDTLSASINNLNAANLALISQNNILCFGEDSASAVVGATGGAAPYDFVWMFNSTIFQSSNNVLNNDTIVTTQAGQYLLEVTDSSGCVSTLQVNITGPASALSVSGLSITDATCGNNDGAASIVVTGGTQGGGYQYTWQPSGGNSSSATNLAVGSYTITITDANGCSIDTIVVIGNTDGPLVSINNVINPNCFGDLTGAATAAATGGSGAYTYLWSNGLGTNANAINMGAGNYTVVVTDALGCSGTASIIITQPSDIGANITTSPANCGLNNGTATVIATGGTGPLTYAWNNGATTSFASGFSPGNCSVVVSDSLGCNAAFTSFVNQTGLFTIDAGVDATIQAGSSIELVGSGPANGTYNWSPAEFLSCSTCVNTIATPEITTAYVLTVTQNGCAVVDTVVIEVELECGDIFVPSGFSPNGDLFNDVLFPRGNCISYLEFKVFDRFGELVFESMDQNTGWDGTYKGKPVLPGVYVYYLSATVKGDILFTHGDVTLVR